MRVIPCASLLFSHPRISSPSAPSLSSVARQLAGQSLSANLGCFLPFDNNPYQDLNAAPRLRSAGATATVLNAMLAVLVALYCLWG